MGDTITSRVGGVTEPLPGYREAKPMVYTGLFPIESDQYEAPQRGPREAVAERPRP